MKNVYDILSFWKSVWNLCNSEVFRNCTIFMVLKTILRRMVWKPYYLHGVENCTTTKFLKTKQSYWCWKVYNDEFPKTIQSHWCWKLYNDNFFKNHMISMMLKTVQSWRFFKTTQCQILRQLKNLLNNFQCPIIFHFIHHFIEPLTTTLNIIIKTRPKYMPRMTKYSRG